MIHFLPDPDCAEALSPSTAELRAGGLARALAVIAELGGEAPGFQPAAFALAADDPRLDHFSERAVAASAAGLEAIAALASAGGSANPAAARLLADTIRDALDGMGARLSL
ncbi:hypothetical protein [Sphingomonas mesophila]|uniref:hypothetical protein n=1 Tax=Sphingomonas mesophila TaxID=2303576 RepID=UPI000E56F7F4|nr:hypothetical protein [Sphingomonas mesophila]